MAVPSRILQQKNLGSVRLGKVEYSSGREPRPSKRDRALGSELWVGDSNDKD